MYARLCVEVDLGIPLLPEYIVDGNHLNIEYEGLYLICFNCGKYGHSLEQCPSKHSQPGNTEKEGNKVKKRKMGKPPIAVAEDQRGNLGNGWW